MPCISRMPTMPSLTTLHPPPAEARYWVPIWSLAILASALNSIYVFPYCIALIKTRTSPKPPSLSSRVKLALMMFASILLWFPSIFSSGLGAWAAYSWSIKADSNVLKALAAGLVVITAVNVGAAFAATANLMTALRTCQGVGRMHKARLEAVAVVYRDEKAEKEIEIV